MSSLGETISSCFEKGFSASEPEHAHRYARVTGVLPIPATRLVNYTGRLSSRRGHSCSSVPLTHLTARSQDTVCLASSILQHLSVNSYAFNQSAIGYLSKLFQFDLPVRYSKT